MLTVDDWLDAGYALLAEDGVKGLKIDRLCRRVGATKGSFYWHFEHMDGYRAALASAWGEWRDDDHRAMDALSSQAPRERLEAMMGMLISPRQWTLERSMREWARSDAAVAEAVRASDRRAVRAVRKAFSDAGFDAPTARQRAEWTFAVGVGFLHLSGSQPDAEAAAGIRQLVEFMLRP